jgi:hypothetical protein
MTNYTDFCYGAMLPPNELRIDVAARAYAEARFNVPPHQSELN